MSRSAIRSPLPRPDPEKSGRRLIAPVAAASSRSMTSKRPARRRGAKRCRIRSSGARTRLPHPDLEQRRVSGAGDHPHPRGGAAGRRTPICGGPPQRRKQQGAQSQNERWMNGGSRAGGKRASRLRGPDPFEGERIWRGERLTSGVKAGDCSPQDKPATPESVQRESALSARRLRNIASDSIGAARRLHLFRRRPCKAR